MPSEFGPEDQRGEIRVAVSPVLDFQFGLFLLTKHCLDPEKSVPDWALEVEALAPDSVGGFMRFWSEAGLGDVDGAPYRECGELLVAGWKTGTLFGASVEEFLDAAEGALERGFEVPGLRSEPPGVVQMIRDRVRWLHDHPDGRRAFIEIHRQLARRIEKPWRDYGKAAAEAAARDLAMRVRTENDVRVLVPGNSFVHKEAFAADIAEARGRGELTLVPLGLAGGGQVFWAFPGMVLLGSGVDSAEREARRRERSERAAVRLKVLSDPTRVAILYELLRGQTHNPSTVTELASQFGLSQPTVSVHVKMLREAGLVQAERDGNQVFYRAEEATIRAYVDAAVDDLLQKPEGAAHAPNLVPATV